MLSTESSNILLRLIPTLDESHLANYKIVMNDLILITRCHACGEKFPVCLFGYVGRYCNKQCWKYNEFYLYDNFKCPFGCCKHCDDYNIDVSKANSRYHIDYYKGKSPSGFIWPMCSPTIPCKNECIMKRDTISIEGYNAFSY